MGIKMGPGTLCKVCLSFIPPLLLCTYTDAFNLHLPKKIYFVNDMKKIYFLNYYQSKNSKQRYKIKKLLHKTPNCSKMANPNNDISPGIKGVLFNNTGDNNR